MMNRIVYLPISSDTNEYIIEDMAKSIVEITNNIQNTNSSL